MKIVLELKDVTKNIRGRTIIDHLSFRFVKAKYSVFWGRTEQGKRQLSG